MPRTIKKYANRRLYDTQSSRHVTLAGIHQLVAAGEDLVVIDDTTGQDITRTILLQVVAEQEQGGHPILSSETLKHLIRSYGQPVQELLSSCLDRSVETFVGQQALAQPMTLAGAGATLRADRPPNPQPHEGGPGQPPGNSPRNPPGNAD